MDEGAPAEAPDAERVQQAGVSVGLRGRRGIGGERSAQVAEPGRGNDAKSTGDQRLGDLQALIEPAACAMHDQHRRAIAGHGNLDGTTGRLDDLTAGRDTLARLMNIALVAGVGDAG